MRSLQSALRPAAPMAPGIIGTRSARGVLAVALCDSECMTAPTRDFFSCESE